MRLIVKVYVYCLSCCLFSCLRELADCCLKVSTAIREQLLSWWFHFLGTYFQALSQRRRKLLLASSYSSLRTSVRRLEKLDSRWADFRDVLYWSLWLPSVEKFKFARSWTKLTGTWQEDQSECITTLVSVVILFVIFMGNNVTIFLIYLIFSSDLHDT